MALPPQRMGGRDPSREVIPSAGDHPQLFEIRKWGGIDTKADRTAIDDNDFSWLENMMPIGDGNMQCLFANAAPLYTASGVTILEFYWFNISRPASLGGDAIGSWLFFSDGSSGVVGGSFGSEFTTFASGVFATSPTLPDFVQWGSSGLLLLDSVALRAWDLSSGFGPGGEFNHVSPGWLQGFTNIQLTGNTHTNTTIDNIQPNTSGLAVGQVITNFSIPDGTYITAINSSSQITISQATSGNFTGTAINVMASPNPTGNLHSNTTIDGMSSTAGLFAGMSVFSQGNITLGTTVASVVSSSSITISQNALNSNSGVQLAFSWPMPSGVSGNAISIFENRLFIENGGITQISAPQNGTDFAAAQGGTSFTSTDSFLKQQFTKGIQSNGFQYLIADSSIQVISNIQTGGSPTATTFNNQNVDSQMGSIWKDTVQPFGRGIMFANPSGVYALYGGAAEKVSDHLDGLFANANFTTLTPTAGVATIFGVRVFVINIHTIDYLGVSRNIMCLWDGKKWFLSSQLLSTVFIGTQEINSVITLWGTDGTNLFQMFQTPSATLNKVLQTKLWSGDGYVIVKQALRNFCLGTDFSGQGYQLTGTIDLVSDIMGFITTPTSLKAPLQFVQWVNNNAQNVQLQNNAAQNVLFLANAVLTMLGQNVNGSGSLMGETLTSTSLDFTLVALTLQYRRQSPVGG
jgi:hypothetical protein